MTVPADAPKPWSLPLAVATTGLGVPALFWLRFGCVGEMAWGTTGFLLLLVLAMHYLPRKVAELGPHSEARVVKRGPFDWLGVVWLLSIPFGPFFGWLLTSAFELTADNWRVLVGTRALLCVLVPVVCVLPLLRHVRGRLAAFQCAVLAIGTTFPVLTGLGAARETLRGPVWEDVVVDRLLDRVFKLKTGGELRDPDYLVELADGRTLTRAEPVALRRGPAHVLVLRGYDRIIAAR